MGAAILSLGATEAQRYVAPEFLRAGVAAGARPARALLEWALRNEIREWVDALTTLINGLVIHAAAATGTLSACYRSLVLPFAEAAAIDTMTRLSSALKTAQDLQELEALTEAVEVVALGSRRRALREAVAGRPKKAAEIQRDKSVTDPDAPGFVVDAFEGLSLTLRELQARVQSVADVEDLARRLKPNAYLYRWELILAPFVAQATADDLFAAAAAIPQNDYAWKVLAAIADRLLDLGDARARAIVERVLRSSRTVGWSRRYDGGSRLTAYELLVRASPEAGRHAAWEALRDDIAAGEMGELSVFREWDRIIATLAPDTSAVDIWEVVSRHVAALVAYAPQGEPLTLPPAEDPTDPIAAADAVSGLVVKYLDHPAYALAQGAQQFFTDRLLAGDAVAEAALAARLSDAEAPKDGALLVLRAIARVRDTVPGSVQQALRTLRHAPNYPDRRAVHALLGPDDADDRDGSAKIPQGARPPLIYEPLPAVFSLVHPPAPPPRQHSVPERGAMLERAEDAVDLVSMFRSELDLIARWGGVQSEALYRYVADRATASLPPGRQDYTFDDEPEIREELHRLGLEVTYRRPRPRRVERAMAEATAMLVDRGRLKEKYFPALDRLFRNADPYFLIVRPTQRPAVVAPIPERAESNHVGRDWTARVTVDDAITGRSMPGLLAALADGPGGAISERSRSEAHKTAGVDRSADDGWIVVAEETWLRWLDWKYATEMRVGARLEPRVAALIDPDENTEEAFADDDIDGDIPAGLALDAHVADFSYLTADEYLTHARAPFSIVVRNHTYHFQTPGRSWLAFNPALAEHLGWRLASDGLFRWLDTDENVVAESIWWQDGFTQHRPPHFDDEVGHGWLVCVSARGYRQLAATVGACVDWRQVRRLAREQPLTGVVEWDPAPDVSR
jgi:hypothetical protein